MEAFVRLPEITNFTGYFFSALCLRVSNVIKIFAIICVLFAYKCFHDTRMITHSEDSKLYANDPERA